jgi:hypothetical protein
MRRKRRRLGRGVDEIKNRSEKCEGSDEGGIDGLKKNQSEKCEGPGEGDRAGGGLMR